MMPTYDRETGRPRQSAPAQTPPPPPSRPAPPRPEPQPARPGRKRRPHVGRWIVAAIVLWVVYLVAVPLWAFSTIHKVDASPQGERPAAQPGTTYLLVGSDSRAGLSAEQRKQLTTGDAGGQRTDTIMLLHTGSGPSTLISIPRDSLVPIPGHGTTKINAAYAYGGPRLLIRTLEQDTGLRIDDYIEIGFGGYVNAVDAVGGVEICPKRDIKDRDSGLDVKKGCQQVEGIQALAWSRARHPFPTGDIARAQHQREVVAQIGSKVKSPWTVLNPVRYYRLNKAATSSVSVGEGTGPLAMVGFARGMTGVTGGGGKTCSMPIRDLAVHWDRDRALQLLKLVKEDRTGDIPKNLCTPTGLRP